MSYRSKLAFSNFTWGRKICRCGGKSICRSFWRPARQAKLKHDASPQEQYSHTIRFYDRYYCEAIDRPYARLEMQLLQVAEAMPAEEFAFRPSPAVRTFGEQLRHVAAVQWVVGSAVLSEKPPVHVGKSR